MPAPPPLSTCPVPPPTYPAPVHWECATHTRMPSIQFCHKCPCPWPVHIEAEKSPPSDPHQMPQGDKKDRANMNMHSMSLRCNSLNKGPRHLQWHCHHPQSGLSSDSSQNQHRCQSELWESVNILLKFWMLIRSCSPPPPPPRPQRVKLTLVLPEIPQVSFHLYL